MYGFSTDFNGTLGAVNPFTPDFGTTPRLLVGRDEVLGQIGRAFGPGFDPHRTTWLRAARGTGKTVLLNEVQDLAGLAGWAVVQEDAQTSRALCDRIVRRLRNEWGDKAGRRVRGVNVSTPIGGGGVEFEQSDDVEDELRDTLTDLLDRPDPPSGVLITVDEIHNADREQLARFGNAVQHLKRQDRPIAAVVAGLPPTEDDDLATFLGRCTKPDLEALSSDIVRVGLQQTAALEGGRFSGAALDLAVTVSGGYPYMLQLVGYWSWDRTDDGVIDVRHVRAALARCERELSEALLQLRRPLTGVEQHYLQAMAVDDGASSTREVARRLGQTDSYAGTYRRRLLDKGVLVEAGTGKVDFAVPGQRARIRIGMELSRSIGTLEPGRDVAN